jgi:hypothetical protein
MLPLHRKQKVDDVDTKAFPYRFAKPAMFARSRAVRLTPRQIRVGGGILVCLILWLLLRGGERYNRYKSPYAATSGYLGDKDVRPIVDITVRECTRWRWFEWRSSCTDLLREGWEVAGGDLLLDTGKYRTHLFIQRGNILAPEPFIVDIQVGSIRPSTAGTWEYRPQGLWITRRPTFNIDDTITAIDFIHGTNVRELRRGRRFVDGGQLPIGQDVYLSIRRGSPPPREMPVLKVSNTRPFKVLQVAGTLL